MLFVVISTDYEHPSVIVTTNMALKKWTEVLGNEQLEGDKWTVCMTLPGVAASERPKDFATKGTGNVVFVFERQKAGK